MGILVGSYTNITTNTNRKVSEVPSSDSELKPYCGMRIVNYEYTMLTLFLYPKIRGSRFLTSHLLTLVTAMLDLAMGILLLIGATQLSQALPLLP